jgi:hypothetical protein
MDNYYHPLAFSYFPDGLHDRKAELEPGVEPGGTGSGGCSLNKTCPLPMYFLQGEYLGNYSNIPVVKNSTTYTEDFGLEVYSSLFRRDPVNWRSFGNFKVMLRFNHIYNQDLFYYCHVSSLLQECASVPD